MNIGNDSFGIYSHCSDKNKILCASSWLTDCNRSSVGFVYPMIDDEIVTDYQHKVCGHISMISGVNSFVNLPVVKGHLCTVCGHFFGWSGGHIQQALQYKCSHVYCYAFSCNIKHILSIHMNTCTCTCSCLFFLFYHIHVHVCLLQQCSVNHFNTWCTCIENKCCGSSVTPCSLY